MSHIYYKFGGLKACRNVLNVFWILIHSGSQSLLYCKESRVLNPCLPAMFQKSLAPTAAN